VTFNLIDPLIALLLCLILFVLVLHRDFRSMSHRLFAVFLLGMGLWGGLMLGMRASPGPQQALIWERAFVPWMILAAVTFLHFSFIITRRRANRWLLRGMYFFFATVVILSPTELVVKSMGEDAYGFFPIFGPVFYLAVIFLYISYPYGIVNLIKGYHASYSYEERNSYIYMVAGVVAFLLGGLIDLASILGVAAIPPLSLWGNVLFCFLTSIALLRYHLLDIQLVLRRGTTYFLMSAFIALPFVSFIFLFHWLFGSEIPLWTFLLLIMVIAFSFQPIWSKTQQWVDRFFYRERYNFFQALEDFSQEVHDITDLKQLCSSLVQLMSKALQNSGAYILLKSGSGDFNIISSVGEGPGSFTVTSSNPLVHWLRLYRGLTYQRDLDSIPQLQALSQKDTSKFKEINTELFVPMKTKKEELIGILILGKKLSHQPYSREEIKLVLTITAQIATEVENARLYDSERTMRAELEKRDEQKTEFLYSVGHELKTPLTAIISSSELLSEDSSTSHKLRERLIANIRTSANSMNRRVTELFDLAQMQIGGLKIESEPLEMNPAITEVASQLRILFEKKEQALTLEIPDSLSRVNADKGKLEQVLFNLLSNANKFSPTGSDITLRAREMDRRIIVEVEDSAPAVTEGEKMRLFDAYYRGEDVGKRERFSGLGLGLTISKKIVELHQGEIWVESKPGKGNIFAFSLPVLDQRTNGIK